jgi:hypothetical protein
MGAFLSFDAAAAQPPAANAHVDHLVLTTDTEGSATDSSEGSSATALELSATAAALASLYLTSSPLPPGATAAPLDSELEAPPTLVGEDGELVGEDGGELPGEDGELLTLRESVLHAEAGSVHALLALVGWCRGDCDRAALLGEFPLVWAAVLLHLGGAAPMQRQKAANLVEALCRFSLRNRRRACETVGLLEALLGLTLGSVPEQCAAAVALLCVCWGKTRARLMLGDTRGCRRAAVALGSLKTWAVRCHPTGPTKNVNVLGDVLGLVREARLEARLQHTQHRLGIVQRALSEEISRNNAGAVAVDTAQVATAEDCLHPLDIDGVHTTSKRPRKTTKRRHAA